VTEKAFRLDFFIAIAALVVSVLTSATLLYQTRIIGDQYAATIWPYLSISSTYSTNGEKIELSNEGLGPALIQSAQLSIDGKNVATWNTYLADLLTQPEIRGALVRAARASALKGTISTASIGASSTIRPGDSKTLLLISWPDDVPIASFTKHAIALDFCYCSLNKSCWTLHGVAGRDSHDEPQQVSHCDSSAGIGSTPMSPSVHPRRKSP
jgi:hypothetical protein